MTRDESLDPILQPWMDRNAPAAPQDLLPRVMREVDTMSQRTTTWPRLLFTAHPTAWVLVTAAAAILAVSLGAFLLSSGTRPVGGDATPAPDQASGPTTVAELVDAGLDAFNAHDSVAVARLFTENATYRAAIGWSYWNYSADGLDAIKQEFATHAAPDVATRHGSVLENGSFAAAPLSWTVSWTADGTSGPASSMLGSGFVVWHLDGMKVQSWSVFTIDGIPGGEPAAWEAANDPDSIVSKLIAMWNTRDASAAATIFAVNGQARFAIGSADWTAEYQSPQAIGTALTGVGTAPGTLTRTGAVIKYGRVVAFAATLTSGDGAAKVFVILKLSPDDTLVLDQWVIGG